jgi:hypothetical protein
MIVINKNPGRLCNHLWSFTPFISLCLENNDTLLIKHFGEYHNLFEDLSLFSNIQFDARKAPLTHYLYNKALVTSTKLSPRLVLKTFNIYTDQYFWERAYQKSNGKKNNIVFVSVDYPKTNLGSDRFHQQLRTLFRPKKQHIEKVNDIISRQRSKFDVIIGVHIRRGDYRYFKQGAYLFDDQAYHQYMIQLEKIFRDRGKTVTFILCSDEPINIENFKSVNSFYIKQPNLIEDLYALSVCDYLIGPPSTFSMWASFYGKVPLQVLKTSKDTLSLAEFSPIVSQDRFENGAVFSH